MVVFISKMIAWVMRKIGMGATTLPGRIALSLRYDILNRLSRGVKVIIITGTNGKTTSARIVEEGLKRAGKSYFVNRSGANLITGITTSFIMNSNWRGRCKTEYAVIECDENAFVTVSRYLDAQIVLVTNVFRDQLDRFGEVDHTLSAIRQSVENLPSARLVLNADCSMTNSLTRDGTVTFGVDVPMPCGSEVLDGTHCSLCGEKLIYSHRTYAHLGCYRCEGCGFCRGRLNYAATSVFEQSEGGSTIVINNKTLAKINLGGMYNIYNAMGAYAALITAGIGERKALDALEHFGGAFGRMERFGNARMILVKNPAGLSQTCRHIQDIKGKKTMIFCLSDKEADGRDISWIWDADIIAQGDIYVSGRRSGDMLLRLKYEGIDAKITDDVLQTVLETKGDVYIIPTYTAMMEIRPQFAKHYGKKEFWK